MIFMFFIPPLILLFTYLYWVVLAPRFSPLRCHGALQKTPAEAADVEADPEAAATPAAATPAAGARPPFVPSPFDVFVMSTTLILYIAYPSMARFLFKMLACRTSGNQRWLDVDVLEPCDEVSPIVVCILLLCVVSC